MMTQGDETLGVRRKLAMNLLRAVAMDMKSPYVWFFVGTLIFSASSFLLPQYFLMFSENAAKITEISVANFLPSFVLFGLAIAGVLFISSLGTNYMREWFQLKVERYLRTKVLHRLHELSIGEIDQVQRGDWLTSVTSDLRNVERFIAESLPGQLRSLLMLVGSGAVFIFYSRSMAAVPILACVLIALVNVWVQKRIMPLLAEIRDLHGDVIQSLLQSLEGIKTIRSYGAEEDQKRRFSVQLVMVEKKGLRVARCFGLLVGSNDAATQILTTLSLTFIMIALSKGDMTLAAALAYPFYLNLFYNAAEFLAASSLDWNEFFISGGRFAEVTGEHESTVPVKATVADTLLSTAQRVDLKDVSFGYAFKRPLRSGLNLSFDKNEIVVILGPSGSGKSTFLEILSGIRQPFSGEWEILGHDEMRRVEAFAKSPLPSRLMAYVEQKPYIFEGSLLDNLLLGEEKAPDEVWEALAEVNLTAFAQENGGLEHFLQDDGQNLSEGQRYRIALARALLTKRPFLLLDEPFAALDQANAKLIAATLRRCRAHCGIILVTHFIPSSLKPDRVIDFTRAKSGKFKAIPQIRQDLRVEW